MTFAAYPFSAQPFSASGQEIRVYFDIISSLEASFEYKIYVATNQFASLPTDALVSQPFRGVLDSYSFQRSILSSTIGKFTTGSGSLVISNVDAFYDFLPLYYTIDARPITLRITRADGSYDDAFPF